MTRPSNNLARYLQDQSQWAISAVKELTIFVVAAETSVVFLTSAKAQVISPCGLSPPWSLPSRLEERSVITAMLWFGRAAGKVIHRGTHGLEIPAQCLRLALTRS